jgi:hypothetical protein
MAVMRDRPRRDRAPMAEVVLPRTAAAAPRLCRQADRVTCRLVSSLANSELWKACDPGLSPRIHMTATPPIFLPSDSTLDRRIAQGHTHKAELGDSGGLFELGSRTDGRSWFVALARVALL